MSEKPTSNEAPFSAFDKIAEYDAGLNEGRAAMDALGQGKIDDEPGNDDLGLPEGVGKQAARGEDVEHVARAIWGGDYNVMLNEARRYLGEPNGQSAWREVESMRESAERAIAAWNTRAPTNTEAVGTEPDMGLMEERWSELHHRVHELLIMDAIDFARWYHAYRTTGHGKPNTEAVPAEHAPAAFSSDCDRCGGSRLVTGPRSCPDCCAPADQEKAPAEQPGYLTDADAAKIGRSVLAAIEANVEHPMMNGWSPAEDYGEIIGDLLWAFDQKPCAVCADAGQQKLAEFLSGQEKERKVEPSDEAIEDWLKRRWSYADDVRLDFMGQKGWMSIDTVERARALVNHFCTRTLIAKAQGKQA